MISHIHESGHTVLVNIQEIIFDIVGTIFMGIKCLLSDGKVGGSKYLKIICKGGFDFCNILIN